MVRKDVAPPNLFPEPLTRKAYKVGGSVAVRLPKELAEAAGIEPDTPVTFRREGRGILVERA